MTSVMTLRFTPEKKRVDARSLKLPPYNVTLPPTQAILSSVPK